MPTALEQQVSIHFLGQQDYLPTYHAMQDFTQKRDENSMDEIWIVEHPSVFTLGRNGKKEHILDAGDIPVVPIDRGGQVTYHGIGQLVVCLLLDIRRKSIGVRELVTRIENSIIDYLSAYNIKAESKRDAPGVYVSEKKIAALGLRVSKGRCYHGLSLNVDMDLSPFQRINPCGYQGLEVTQCHDLGIKENLKSVADALINHHLLRHLEYGDHHHP